MSPIFVITTNEALEASLNRYFRCAYGSETHSCRLPPPSESSDKSVWVWNAFRRLSNWIECAVQKERKNSLRDSIAVLDLNAFNHRWNENGDAPRELLADPLNLNPLEKDKADWKAVAAMLILAFPEVHWIFPGVSPSAEDIFFYRDAHLLSASFPLRDLLRFHRQAFVSLFDPSNLRNILRKRVKEKSEEGGHIPQRDCAAAAIDEEEAYAYFNTYTAYRFGYRGWTVASLAMMDRLFENEYDVPGDLELLLEDLYLRFPDRPEERKLSDLYDREEELPGLKATSLQRRILITVGHQRYDSDRMKRHRNTEYLRAWIDKGRSNGIRRTVKRVHKPLGGIFDLWRKAGMWCWHMWSWRGKPKTPVDFEWPPESGRNAVHENSGGHSAPGRLLVIAERLIERSRAVLQDAQSVPKAVYAAALALEAKELLGNRTPTTALEALALQHQAEVKAESMFHGIEYNLDAESRFKDIKDEVEAIGRWFSARKRKRSTLNARLAIVEDLARSFRELNQFEEEQLCLREARRLSTDFWVRQKPGRWLVWPVLKYVNFSLRSLTTFVVLVLCWTAVFGLSYHFLEPLVMVGTKSFGEAFGASTEFFFTLQSASDYWMFEGVRLRTPWYFFLAFQGVISLLHLGLLVSHVYIIVSRR